MTDDAEKWQVAQEVLTANMPSEEDADPDCEDCTDGYPGVVFNNADPSCGQWVACPCTYPEEIAARKDKAKREADDQAELERERNKDD